LERVFGASRGGFIDEHAFSASRETASPRARSADSRSYPSNRKRWEMVTTVNFLECINVTL
jgi:hypothetical protein